MKVETPEISWHGRDPVYSADFQPGKHTTCRLATASTDTNVQIWYVSVDNDGKAQPTFAASLSRHTKAVNVVRFSRDGELLASGADDGLVILWKLQEVGNIAPVFGKEDEECKETWAAMKTLRGHLEDVYDISWSSDGSRMITGSVDNSAIIWDTQKGEKLFLLKDHRSFVQGVAWDPKDRFCATISCDRSLRVYNLLNNRCIHHVNKLTMAATNNNGEGMTKQYRMFHDDTMKSFFRRLTFSPDGELLIVPAGILEMGDSALNTTYVFSSASFSKPVLHLPCPSKATIAVRCCPILFELRTEEATDTSKSPSDKNSNPTQEKTGTGQAEEPMETDASAPSNTTETQASPGQEKSDSSKEVTEGSTKTTSDPESSKEKATQLFDLPYRMVFGVATEDSLLLYDTQQSIPFGLISNIHYHQLSDVTWSPDGRILAVSSTDGYCSFVTFEPGELGVPYVTQPIPAPASTASPTTASAPVPPRVNTDKASPPSQAAVSTTTVSPQTTTNQSGGILKPSNEQQMVPRPVVVKQDGGNGPKRITPIALSGSGSGTQPRRIQLTTLSSLNTGTPTATPTATPSSTSAQSTNSTIATSAHIAKSPPKPKDHKHTTQNSPAPTNQDDKTQNGPGPSNTQAPKVPHPKKLLQNGMDNKDVIDLTMSDDEEEDEDEEEEEEDDVDEEEEDDVVLMDAKDTSDNVCVPKLAVRTGVKPLKPVAPAPRRMTTIKLDSA